MPANIPSRLDKGVDEMINYHSIETKENNLLYGPGKRLVLFTQGCGLKCPGCSNWRLWERGKGENLDPRELANRCESPDVEGLTLHGGEPTEQTEELLPAVEKIKDMGKSVILLTGREIEELQDDSMQRELLTRCDIVKCGRYVKERQNLFLHFRGSDNQRVIINPEGALKNYQIKDGTNTVLIAFDKENGSINVNGMVDEEMQKLLAEYAELNMA